MTEDSTQPTAAGSMPAWQGNGAGSLEATAAADRPEVELAIAFGAGLILARLIARWARGRE